MRCRLWWPNTEKSCIIHKSLKAFCCASWNRGAEFILRTRMWINGIRYRLPARQEQNVFHIFNTKSFLLNWRDNVRKCRVMRLQHCMPRITLSVVVEWKLLCQQCTIQFDCRLREVMMKSSPTRFSWNIMCAPHVGHCRRFPRCHKWLLIYLSQLYAQICWHRVFAFACARTCDVVMMRCADCVHIVHVHALPTRVVYYRNRHVDENVSKYSDMSIRAYTQTNTLFRCTNPNP